MDKGFIYRTRSRGANGVPALYAVTWLSIVKKDDLYLRGFKKDLFLEVEVKNTTPKVMKTRSSYWYLNEVIHPNKSKLTLF